MPPCAARRLRCLTKSSKKTTKLQAVSLGQDLAFCARTPSGIAADWRCAHGFVRRRNPLCGTRRLVVGAVVHARAAIVLQHNVNKVVHGSEAARIMINGIIQEVKVQLSASNRRLTYLCIRFFYANSLKTEIKWFYFVKLNMKTLSIASRCE